MTHHIKYFMQDTFSKKDSWKWKLLANWSTIIGELADKVTVEKIEEHTIVLGVTQAAWLQELYLLTPLLRSRINATLDAPHIKQVRFKAVGKKKRNTHISKPSQSTGPNPILTLSPREQRALQATQDIELRDALKAYKLRCLKEK